MTEREVLNLALEALEVVEPHTFPDSDAELFSRSAITACREALAQQQEPVAYGMWDTMLGKGNRMMMVRLDKGQDGCTVPLYTTPPQPEPVIDKSAAVRIATALGWEPKRTWVGLTDEEIAEIMVQIWSNNNISVRERSHRLARAIEVKLKEKNT